MKIYKATINLEYTEDQIKSYSQLKGWSEPEVEDEANPSFVVFARDRIVSLITKDFKDISEEKYMEAARNAQAQVDAVVEANIQAGLSVTVEETTNG